MYVVYVTNEAGKITDPAKKAAIIAALKVQLGLKSCLPLMLLIYLPPMPDRQHQYHDPSLLDPADNPVIPHAIAPQPRQVGRQCFAKMPGILTSLDPVIQIVENSLPYRFVETIQLMYGIRRKLNPPGQGRASLPHAKAFCHLPDCARRLPPA